MINQTFALKTPIAAAKSDVRSTESKRHNPFVYFALALTLLVSLAQSGCTGLTSANAPADPTMTTTVAVSGSTGSFGSVATGSSATQTFVVSNTGTVALTITQLATSGTGFSVSGLTLPATVNAGKTASFTVKFAPASAGAATGSLSMTANTSPAVSVIALSGTGAGAGQSAITVSPSNFDFGNIAVGTTSTKMVTISNTSNVALTISSISSSGPGFTVSAVAIPLSVPANQSVTINAIFVPTAVGPVGGNITIANNSPTPNAVVAEVGTGTGPNQGQAAISVSPSSFDFGNVAMGVASSHTFTILNSGGAALSISNIAAAGSGFSVSGFTLPISVPANGSTSITAKFAPTASGPGGATLTFTNNSSTPSVVVSLSGTGVSAGQPLIATNPTSVSFGNVVIGSPNSQTILIQNNGTTPLTISSASATGAGLSISGLAVPATVASGGSTTFNVAFAPTAAGAISGSVSLVSNAASSPTAIPISGTGVSTTMALTASTNSLAFGSVAVGSNGSQNVVLTNGGNSTVTIGTVNVTGAGFAASGVTAGQMIGAGQTATLAVTFTPATAATFSGAVSVTSNAGNSPISIALSGTGSTSVAHSVSLTWTPSTSTVVGYNVYRSTVSGGPYTLMTASSVLGAAFTDNSVQAGVTYFYVVTAVDASGNESAFSNEASATVPTP